MIKCLELTFKLLDPQDKKNIPWLTLAANGDRAYTRYLRCGRALYNKPHPQIAVKWFCA